MSLALAFSWNINFQLHQQASWLQIPVAFQTLGGEHLQRAKWVRAMFHNFQHDFTRIAMDFLIFLYGGHKIFNRKE
jgi:hypothetical protein